METRHNYNPKQLFRTWFIALVGIVISITMLFIFKPILVMTLIWVLIIAICMFGAYRAWDRQRVLVIMDESTITFQSFTTTTVEWDKISDVKLAFFAKRPDQRDGWMRLTLTYGTGGKRAVIDSQISGFLLIVERAAKTIKTNRLEIDHLTRVNLHAIGLAT